MSKAPAAPVVTGSPTPASQTRSAVVDTFERTVENNFGYDVPPSTPAKIQKAYGRLRPFLRPTELRNAHTIDPGYDQIYYKCEHTQWTGSFKERGALNFLLQLNDDQKKIGVIAASAGNHAQALAYHGNQLNIPVTVVMPTIAPLTKIERCRTFGARVIVHGATIADSKKEAERLLATTGQLYVNGYDDPRIVNGAGTCGIEIMEQLPDVDAVVVPTGGAGLLAGIALAVKQRNSNVRIVAVESEACPSYTQALEAGKPVMVDVQQTLADGLHVPKVGAHSFHVSRELVDETIVVKEQFFAMAILRMLEKEKMMIEGAGAAGVAALLSGQLSHLRGMKTVIVLCGGNIDITTLGRVIDRALHIERRFLRFNTVVSDKPGGLADFAQALAETGATVKDIMQERPFIQSALVTRLRVSIESRGAEHSDDILAKMKRKGYVMAVDTDEDVVKAPALMSKM